MKSAPTLSVSCQTHTVCFCLCLRRGWQVLTKMKREWEKFLCIDAWMTSRADRKEEAESNAHALCKDRRLRSHVHRKDERTHGRAAHLPRHQNTSSPDKLERARALCCFGIAVLCHISVRAARAFTPTQRKLKRTLMSSFSPSFSPSFSLSPVVPRWDFFVFCWKKRECGAEVSITCCITLSLGMESPRRWWKIQQRNLQFECKWSSVLWLPMKYLVLFSHPVCCI